MRFNNSETNLTIFFFFLLAVDDHNKHTHKDRKSMKKTRWGSDEDRVPLDVLNKLNKFGLLGKDSSTAPTSVNFYSENDSTRKDEREREERPKTKDLASLNAIPKDVDLRQLLAQKSAKATASVTDQVAKVKIDESHNRDEVASSAIEASTDDDDKSELFASFFFIS